MQKRHNSLRIATPTTYDSCHCVQGIAAKEQSTWMERRNEHTVMDIIQQQTQPVIGWHRTAMRDTCWRLCACATARLVLMWYAVLCMRKEAQTDHGLIRNS